jgi:hypothetical protein
MNVFCVFDYVGWQPIHTNIEALVGGGSTSTRCNPSSSPSYAFKLKTHVSFADETTFLPSNEPPHGNYLLRNTMWSSFPPHPIIISECGDELITEV